MTSAIDICIGDGAPFQLQRGDYEFLQYNSNVGFCIGDSCSCEFPVLVIPGMGPQDRGLLKLALTFDGSFNTSEGIFGRFDVVERVIVFYFGAQNAGLERWEAFELFLLQTEIPSSPEIFLSYFAEEGHLLAGGLMIDSEEVLALTDYPEFIRRSCAVLMDPYSRASALPNDASVLVGFGAPQSLLNLLGPTTAVIAGQAAAHIVAPYVPISAIDVHVLDVPGSESLIQVIVECLRSQNRIVCQRIDMNSDHIVSVLSGLMQINVLRTRATDIDAVLRGFGTGAFQVCFDGAFVHMTGAAAKDHENFTFTQSFAKADVFPAAALPEGSDVRRETCLSADAPSLVQDHMLSKFGLIRCPQEVFIENFFYDYVHTLHKPQWFGSLNTAIEMLEPTSELPLCVVVREWSPEHVLRVKVVRAASRLLFQTSLLASNLIDGMFLDLITHPIEAYEYPPVEWFRQGLQIETPQDLQPWTFLKINCRVFFSQFTNSFHFQLASITILY